VLAPILVIGGTASLVHNGILSGIFELSLVLLLVWVAVTGVKADRSVARRRARSGRVAATRLTPGLHR
jgi:hypothetical protein